LLVVCWSAKGGAGTTVVAACLALQRAGRAPTGVVLADLAGDIPATLGLPEPDSPGLAGWLAAGEDVPADALRRMEIAAAPGLTLLPRGAGPLEPARVHILANLFEQSSRPVVADCGTGSCPATSALIAAASQSLLVTRPCYLSLRQAVQAAQRPTAVVLVREPGRVLGRQDIERIIGAPVVAEVEVDPTIARAVDAGLLAGAKLPRALEKALRDVA
jgi:MinD-like ATPase involved in chromosome partitioning or flagellar assembly